MFSHFGPETTALLTGVQQSALEEWAAGRPESDSPMLRALVEASIARAILNAAAAGERDPERLKQVALAEAAAT